MKTKILYVEDEPVLAILVRDHLERTGYTVHWQESGAGAIEKFKELQPDVCILDVMLPGISGFELAQQFREVNKHVPILFLTAKSELKDVMEGFKAGGNDYIKKPFSLEELTVRIQNLLKLSGKNDPGQLKLGSLVYDPCRMTLCGGDTIQLSHRENELLRMISLRIGEPVERKELLLQIWGDDHFFNSRNLDVYVTRLRKYLKMDPSIQFLTLKGVGYQLVVG